VLQKKGGTALAGVSIRMECRSECRIIMYLLKASQNIRTREAVCHITCFRCVLCSFANLIGLVLMHCRIVAEVNHIK
jgi:hypothetical protein